jgi:hypothetical protein
MTPTIKFNLPQFQADLQKAVAFTKRPLDKFVSSRLLHVAKTARENTPVASRSKIQSELGAAISKERVNSKGRTVRSYKYKPTPLAYALVNWRRKNANKPPIPRKAMKSAARKLITARLRAVGSLKAGWTRALGILASSVGAAIDRTGPKIKNASTAQPAKPGWRPEARMEYKLTISDGGARQIDPRVVSALEKGFAKEHGELIAHLEKRVKQSLREAGVK